MGRTKIQCIPSSKILFLYTICNNWCGLLKRLSVFFLDSRMKLPHSTAKNAKKLRKDFLVASHLLVTVHWWEQRVFCVENTVQTLIYTTITVTRQLKTRVTLQKSHASRGTYAWSLFHVCISHGKLLRSYFNLTRVQSLCYEALTGDGVLRIATASS